MNLYNVRPQPTAFSWPDSNGERREVPMVGIWLGSPGKNFRHVFIPVVSGNESEPRPDRWGVLESRSKRPKIVANSDASPGMIALLSSYNGDGKTVGNVLADVECLGSIFIIDAGIGGRDRPTMRWHDYLVELTGPARFFIQTTVLPNKLIVYDEKEITVEPIGYQENDATQETNFVLLDDPRIQRWKRERL